MTFDSENEVKLSQVGLLQPFYLIRLPELSSGDLQIIYESSLQWHLRLRLAESIKSQLLLPSVFDLIFSVVRPGLSA